jgi:hypothetical protein
VFILLRTQTGHDFSPYKKSTIYRRVERRMGLHQIDKIATYVRFLRENPQEIELLFKELLIGVTSFFRDPPAWEQLKEEVIPALLAAHPKGGVLRAWTPGCSTGEEAYSLAMVFKEALERVKPAGNFTLQVFATDLDRDAIDRARAGVYPANIAADVSPSACAASSRRTSTATGWARRSARRWSLPPERDHGPALHQARPADLPQPADLPGPGDAKKTDPPLSLQPESRRRPVSGQRGDHRRLHPPVRPAGQKSAALPAARLRPGGRAGRIPLRVCPLSAGRLRARSPRRGSPAPTSRRWRINCSCSASPRRPC